MEHFNRVIEAIAPVNKEAMAKAKEHIDQLTKPVGSLGRLEELAIQLAGITNKSNLEVDKPAVIIAAGDHGVTAEGVSAYPQEVTKLMIENFLQGGAAINVFARLIGASVHVVDVGVNGQINHPELIVRKVKDGTNNFLYEDAMSIEEAVRAIEVGVLEAERLIAEGHQLLIIGEMGIGNTTASSALIAAIIGANVSEAVGRGTGLDNNGFTKKVDVIEQALANRQPRKDYPLEVLAKLGGLEIAMLTGVILAACAKRIPVMIDGLISSAAALIASELSPHVKEYFILSHESQEPGHKLIFSYLNQKPLLSLELRLGEGTGAALAYPLVLAAARMHKEMATFAAAGIEKQEAVSD